MVRLATHPARAPIQIRTNPTRSQFHLEVGSESQSYKIQEKRYMLDCKDVCSVPPKRISHLVGDNKWENNPSIV